MGVRKLYGVADMERLAEGTGMRVKTEHSMTPKELVRELKVLTLHASYTKVLF